MKVQNHISTTTLLVLSLVTTQIRASETISELCRTSNDSGIKRVVNYILSDNSSSPAEILCQQRLNKKSDEAILEATYSANKMNDARYRTARKSIEDPTQFRFRSASSESALEYNKTSEPKVNITLPTLKGFQTVPQ